MSRRMFILCLAIELCCAVILFTPLILAAVPTGATTSLDVPLDEDPSALSIRLVPGDQRYLSFSLTVNDADINTSTTYTSYYIAYKNSLGETLTTQSLSKTTTSTLTCTTGASNITSAVKQAGIICTTGTYRVVAGYFKIIVPSVKTP